MLLAQRQLRRIRYSTNNVTFADLTSSMVKIYVFLPRDIKIYFQSELSLAATCDNTGRVVTNSSLNISEKMTSVTLSVCLSLRYLRVTPSCSFYTTTKTIDGCLASTQLATSVA